MVAATSPSQWISKSEAARALGCTGYIVNKMIERGALVVRELPGDRPRISAESVMRLIEQTKQGGPK